MRIYEILPGKLLLSARTHQLNDSQLAAVLDIFPITGVVNLWHTIDPRVQERVKWYEQVSLPDGQIHTYVAVMAEALACRIVEEIDNGGCVLVHCWGGRNRSGLVIALALTRLQGITGAAAVKAVKAVRSGALVNQHFVKYLEARDGSSANPGDLGVGEDMDCRKSH